MSDSSKHHILEALYQDGKISAKDQLYCNHAYSKGLSSRAFIFNCNSNSPNLQHICNKICTQIVQIFFSSFLYVQNLVEKKY